ncbi:phosphatidylinositol-specific phospholipase C [Deminuibacter soli]|uniref:1-phosphatidylinositol phosphodiesterase n=1 Tax=Deminuibacter soli TaxID=2291815 RepID=A0A3E1NQE5_9BACT|nr:phosphatidylinositol-specific phospholipase C [Deminuibacter soli]RFM30145.1 phosphatidylinositol diacylglycerol-lyase [Deminuibacter soli]
MKATRPVSEHAVCPAMRVNLLKKLLRTVGYSLSLLLLAAASYNCNAHDAESDVLHTVGSIIHTTAAPLNAFKIAGRSPENWMGALPDSVNLSQLSIPGSHDAGACYEPVAGIAKCQNLSIAAQLNIGVRFLDIRCRHVKNGFVINHGPFYQNLYFAEVINTCAAFLRNHPGESIVMSIKEEYRADGCTHSFEQTFANYVRQYPGIWYLGENVPALKEARGKIVLLRRFAAGNVKGIDASEWKKSTFSIDGKQASLRIEDDYVVANPQHKWKSMCTFFDEARTAKGNTLYIGFASGYKPLLFSIPNITAVSKAINNGIAAYFTANTKGRFGIIPMDFADPSRVSLIFNTNF